MAEFQAADSPHQYLPEISELILEDVVESQLVAAAYCDVVAQGMQSQAADKLVCERLNPIAFAIENLDQFAPGLLVVPQPDHIFLLGEGGEDGSVQADVQRIDLALVEALVQKLQDIPLNYFVRPLNLLTLQDAGQVAHGYRVVVEGEG